MNKEFKQPPHDPYFNADYQIGIENAIKQQKEATNMEQQVLETICYEVFMTSDAGKELWRIIQEKYIDKSFVNPYHECAPHAAIYFEGFKESLRGLYAFAKNHEKLLKAGQR